MHLTSRLFNPFARLGPTRLGPVVPPASTLNERNFMNIRAILCAATLAILTTTTQSAVAQQGVKIGRLRCNVSGGLGLIITSTKEMACTFTSARGFREHYYGTIRKFGLDIGETDRGVLAGPFLPHPSDPSRALAGEYAGVDASATIGVGLGANALVGGFGRSIALQPLSVQAQTGLALAARRGADPSPRTLKRQNPKARSLSRASKLGRVIPAQNLLGAASQSKLKGRRGGGRPRHISSIIAIMRARGESSMADRGSTLKIFAHLSRLSLWPLLLPPPPHVRSTKSLSQRTGLPRPNMAASIRPGPTELNEKYGSM